jgi:hypothetical protein
MGKSNKFRQFIAVKSGCGATKPAINKHRCLGVGILDSNTTASCIYGAQAMGMFLYFLDLIFYRLPLKYRNGFYDKYCGMSVENQIHEANRDSRFWDRLCKHVRS